MNKTRQHYAWSAATIILVAVLASLVPIVIFAVGQGGRFTFDPYIWSVLRFTLLQAGLSTLLSIVIALPSALALANTQFFCRKQILALFAVPQMLPAIVVVLGLAGVFGSAGWLPNVIDIYSLNGILLAHTFFNAPLCIRLFVESLEAVAPENRDLAKQLGLGKWRSLQHVEWQVLKTILPRVAALVFMFCAASFVVVLTFGGPAATTLEVAIYQSLRLDFDMARAITLSIVQIALCLALVFFTGLSAHANGTTKPLNRQTGSTHYRRITPQRVAALVLPLALVVPPLLHLVWTGTQSIALRPIIGQAAMTSFAIACISALLSGAIAWPLAGATARRLAGNAAFSTIVLLGLIVPPAVLATGWFLLLREVPASATLSALLIICLNALMALPLVFAILTSAMINRTVGHDQLCAQLGLSGLARLRYIDYPALRSALFQSLLMAGILSLGDLTAVMLLGSNGLVTLPSLIASEMGNYRSSTAQGTALLLAIPCFALAWLAQRQAEIPI